MAAVDIDIVHIGIEVRPIAFSQEGVEQPRDDIAVGFGVFRRPEEIIGQVCKHGFGDFVGV